MGQGGPQKLSTYQSWLEECGFKVTKAITKDPADIAAGRHSRAGHPLRDEDHVARRPSSTL